jgi:acyl-[acyl carrier protein]--UDP-N-acetylglucosamine O-acyltransferase
MIVSSEITQSSATTPPWLAMSRSANTRLLGALSAVHQFVRIGAYAFIGEMAGIPSDVFPFGMATGTGREARLSGLNIVGLKRHGFSSDQLRELRRAFRALTLQRRDT